MKILIAVFLLIPSLSWGEKSNEDYLNEIIDLAKEIKEKNLKYKELEKKCNRIAFIIKEKKPRQQPLKAEDIKRYKKYMDDYYYPGDKDFCREVKKQNTLNDILVNHNFDYYEYCLKLQDSPGDSEHMKLWHKISREEAFCSEVTQLTFQVNEKIFQEKEIIDEKRKRFSNKCFRNNLKDGLSDTAANMLMNTCVEDAEAKYPYKN